MKTRTAFLLFFIFSLVSCALSPDAPRIVSTSVTDGQRVVDADAFREIAVTFSKPMNRRVVERNISLSGYGGDIVYRWENGNRTVLLLLTEPFERGERYVLEIGSGCECADGFDLGRDHRFTLYTYTIEEEFAVAFTEPGDGATVTALDGLEIAVGFSLPVEHTSVFDKVTVEPEFSYRYAFASDRKTLTLSVLEHLEPNELYRVTLSEELSALNGKGLGEPFTFSFVTGVNRDPFRVQRASMVERGSADAGVALDIGYLAKTEGVGKSMDLLVAFSSDYHLSSIKKLISIEPSIAYALVKEGGALRFRFERPMTPETTYRVTFGASMKNVHGAALDREYAFEWVVNGEGSAKLRPELVSIRNPHFAPEEPGLFPHTEIFREGTAVHNQTLLPYYEDGGLRTDIEAVFSAPLDLYRSIDGGNILLDFVYGDVLSGDATLRDFRWEEAARALTLSFSLPALPMGPGAHCAYYKLTLKGGDGGVIDRDGNRMDADVSIYVKYVSEP
jgi:hypothetical protein